jgi:S-adenosylmethionine:tRNA-ribosyltransferase-isomerase (queuine synthetase)
MVIICRLIDGYFPQMDIEYKIVIYYGMKYKCTDFIARGFMLPVSDLFVIVPSQDMSFDLLLLLILLE